MRRWITRSRSGTKGLGEVSGRLAEIEQHPALRVPPAQFGEAVARGRER